MLSPVYKKTKKKHIDYISLSSNTIFKLFVYKPNFTFNLTGVSELWPVAYNFFFFLISKLSRFSFVQNDIQVDYKKKIHQENLFQFKFIFKGVFL